MRNAIFLSALLGGMTFVPAFSWADDAETIVRDHDLGDTWSQIGRAVPGSPAGRLVREYLVLARFRSHPGREGKALAVTMKQLLNGANAPAVIAAIDQTLAGLTTDRFAERQLLVNLCGVIGGDTRRMVQVLSRELARRGAAGEEAVAEAALAGTILEQLAALDRASLPAAARAAVGARAADAPATDVLLSRIAELDDALAAQIRAEVGR